MCSSPRDGTVAVGIGALMDRLTVIIVVGFPERTQFESADRKIHWLARVLVFLFMLIKGIFIKGCHEAAAQL